MGFRSFSNEALASLNIINYLHGAESFLEKLIVTQPRNSLPFMELEGSRARNWSTSSSK
jgi:hypothetical protein